MYNFIKGKIVEINDEKNFCVIETNGIGYEIILSESTLKEIKISDEPIKFYIVEISSGLYSNNLPTLYGFLSEEEKEIFLAFKDNLSNVGPKKALEYLDKVKKNIAEFKSAIKTKNYKLLTSLFGFRHSSAEKIINSLSNLEFFATQPVMSYGKIDVDLYTDLVSALVNLGYKEQQVKPVVEKILTEYANKLKGEHSKLIQQLIPVALKELSLLK